MRYRIEVYGEGGVSYADLHMGNALPTYSEYGYGYAVEKAPSTQGWTYRSSRRCETNPVHGIIVCDFVGAALCGRPNYRQEERAGTGTRPYG